MGNPHGNSPLIIYFVKGKKIRKKNIGTIYIPSVKNEIGCFKKNSKFYKQTYINARWFKVNDLFNLYPP